ncbi:MAG: hypothetical protein J6C82_02620 [Clostridia bacterium]|nr:hypothetical protein [Clostridia bacterium]
MSRKRDQYAQRTIFTILMIISVFLGFIFLATNNLDFIIAALNQGKFHLPNIAYALSRIVSGLLLPFIFVAPPLFRFGRIKLTKIFLIAYGVLYALTLTWIFYFLGSNSFTDLFSNQKIIEFQRTVENSFVATYVNWDTYSWAGSIFTLLYSALCIYAGISFDDNRKKVRYCVLAMLALRILLPTLYSFIAGNGVLSAFWLTNNYADIMSFTLFTAAICLASVDDFQWISLVWDQDVSAENDDDDLDKIRF